MSKIYNMVREQLLDHWLKESLKKTLFKRVPLAGDASFRRYYRIYVEDERYVVMDAPPPEAPHLFVKIARILAGEGLAVPKIIHTELDKGFLLLSDLGDRLYLDELNPDSADTLYQDAFKAILQIQKCQAALPAFDRVFLQKQLGIFEEWYLEKHMGISHYEQTQAFLAPFYELLFQVIEVQPQVVVHRDYHSRNLMIVEGEGPGILDFQDAMIGPVTYDLVSLLQDCYITWPRAKVVEWVADFQSKAEADGILKTKQNFFEFLRWFDWTGLHRHLKNLGIFTRLHYRDNKSGYLKDIPRVLNYILETCDHYPELQPLVGFFQGLNEKTLINECVQ